MSVAALLLALQVIPPANLAEVLPAGPHPVGFSQAWLIDSTRRLPGGERYGLRFRPVLMNLWYPAAATGGTEMRYRDYLDGAVAGG
jgi:hypothetical protein